MSVFLYFRRSSCDKSLLFELDPTFQVTANCDERKTGVNI